MARTATPASSVQSVELKSPTMQAGNVHAVQLIRASSVQSAELKSPKALLYTSVTSAVGNPMIL